MTDNNDRATIEEYRRLAASNPFEAARYFNRHREVIWSDYEAKLPKPAGPSLAETAAEIDADAKALVAFRRLQRDNPFQASAYLDCNRQSLRRSLAREDAAAETPEDDGPKAA